MQLNKESVMAQITITRRDFLLGGMAAGLSIVFLDLRATFARAAVEKSIPAKDQMSPMGTGSPSRTALSAATHRAVHQLVDVPRIFDDPLALRIICENAQKRTWVDLCQLQKKHSLRAFIALRSRYAEDELARAVERGVRQYVVLGAGLDTFAYRNPYPSSRLRVFEVDHPATQAWKRVRLGEAQIAIPESLTFAPVDFEQQTLLEGLKRAGFREDEPAFFSMLGVVLYLTKSAVMETFRFVAALPKGTEIVFDYGIPFSMLSRWQRSAREALAKQVAAMGEPWITYFDPATLAHDLRGLGFNHIEDLDPRGANNLYFKNRADGLSISGSSRIMKARV
jgi:methyltransferase (TIGR00027 family)